MPHTDGTPFSTLEYAYSWLQPHLSPTMDTILGSLLRMLASLPPSVANVLPLVVGGVVVYWALMALLNTVRSTLRQTWFLAKWGTVAVIAAWLYAAVTGQEPINTGGLTGHFKPGGGGIQSLMNQAYTFAGATSRVNDPNSPSSASDWLVRKAYNSFIPAPLRMIAGSVLGESSSKKTRSKRNGRNNDNVEEQLHDTANVATEWFGGLVKQVGEALEGGRREDRWNDQRRRNR